MTAAVVPSMAADTAFRSLNGTYLKPGTIGSKPAWYFGCAVAVSAAYVRPWKPPSMVMIVDRPAAWPWTRASLMAASLASAPLLQKNALPPNARSESNWANSPCGSMYHVLGTWMSKPTCSRTASTIRGGQCPTRLHPQPGKKSR